MSFVGKLSLIAVSGLLLFSCQDAREDAESPEHSHEGAALSIDGLVLNGHERWPMDSHTRGMFGKMGGTLVGGERSVGDHGSYAATGKKMRIELDELIRGCTMQGEGHDQLHNFLMAYIPAVDRMAEVGTKVQADSVRILLDLYPQYFE